MNKMSPLKLFKGGRAVALLMVVLLLCGCGGSKNDPKMLRIGVIAGPEAKIMSVAADIMKNETGIDFTLIEFTDYVSPNIALSEGSIDVNSIQHRPYLDSMIKGRGLKLVAVGNTFIYPIGGYSKKITDINMLKEGAKIAIPNDSTNEGRTLILLHNRGLIKLNDANNLNAMPSDIVENPKRLKFIELDAAQLPRSLDDVDVAFINSNYSVPVDLLPGRDALIVERMDSPYVNIIVSREDNKNDPKVLELVKAYHTKAVEQVAVQLFKGGAVAGWK